MENTFIKGLTKKENTKGGTYHSTTLSANLDLFALNGRYMESETLRRYFESAYNEDKKIFFRNLLFLLDIRGGKGERKLFKEGFKFLIEKDDDYTEIFLLLIKDFGRWDYILEAFDTEKEEMAMKIIQAKWIDARGQSDLFWKWMPSINTSSKEKVRLAKKIAKFIGINESTYRKTLSKNRKISNILETKLVEKDYSFDYSKVPSKAMLKYKKAFDRNDNARYNAFLESLSKGEAKVKATAITPGEIAARVSRNENEKLLDGMWANLKDIKIPEGARVLPMVDTSSSMGDLSYDTRIDEPIAQAIGLGLYFAERNVGAFKNKFLTFSSSPTLQIVKGKTVSQKMRTMSRASWGMSTDIDKSFELVLNSTLKSKVEDVPTHILVISDMEFDGSTRRETNFEHWTKEYAKHGLTLPKIVFWNVDYRTNGFPVTKETENVAMVSGYSVNIAENLFTFDFLTPQEQMLKTLSKYEDVPFFN